MLCCLAKQNQTIYLVYGFIACIDSLVAGHPLHHIDKLWPHMKLQWNGFHKAHVCCLEALMLWHELTEIVKAQCAETVKKEALDFPCTIVVNFHHMAIHVEPKSTNCWLASAQWPNFITWVKPMWKPKAKICFLQLVQH